MKNMRRVVLSFTLLLACVSLMGQNVSPVDFMRLNPYQLNSNPAADLPYISVMSFVIGNVNVNVKNTGLHYNNLFEFDAQGRPTVISLRKMAENMHPENDFNLDLNENLFFLCRQLEKGMLTISYNIRGRIDMKYNDGLFQLLAYGNSAFLGEDHPAIIDMSLDAKAYQEFAVGYQINVTDHLSLGGRAKLLFGFANVDTDVCQAKLITDADSYALRLYEDVAAKASLPGLFIVENGLLKPWGRFSVGDLFHNPGFAVDLGVDYHFNEHFGLAAAVNDLGFIHWGANNFQMLGGVNDAGQYYEDGSFFFQGMDMEQLEQITSSDGALLDTLKQYFQVDVEKGAAYNTMLNANLMLRGYYDLNPQNRFVAQMQGQFRKGGFTPAFTVAYCGSFWNNMSVCASYTAMPNSYTNFGLGLGAMIGICHIYVATNNILGCFNPMNSNGFNVQAGIVFNLFEEGIKVIEKVEEPE